MKILGIYKRKDRPDDNCYWISINYKGRRIRKRIGPSKRQAEREYDRLKVMILDDEYLEDKKTLLKDFAPTYLESCKVDNRLSTYIRKNVSLKKLIAFMGEKLLQNITPFLIEQYKIARKNAGKNNATINRDLACLKHLFGKAIAWGYLGNNPVEKVKSEPPCDGGSVY